MSSAAAMKAWDTRGRKSGQKSGGAGVGQSGAPGGGPGKASYSKRMAHVASQNRQTLHMPMSAGQLNARS